MASKLLFFMKPTLHTLAGGLKVVVEENHTAPVVALNFLVKAGSADETDVEAGICHVIEHMLFKGTKRRKVGQIAHDVEAAGGEVNAYTSFDQTVYYINMATRFMDQGLDILADAVQNPTFDEGELEREKEVILEEIRRERDNPGRWVGEILFQKAYTKHPYGRPIIGFAKTVKSFSRTALFDFYHHWYTPQNSAFLVVGDFKSDEMLTKLETLFTDFSRANTTTLPRPLEPKHSQPIIEIQPDPIQSCHFAFGFHIPRITHEDVPAIDILSHILGGTTSSRLEQILKEKKRLVQSIYTHAYTPKDPGLLLVGGQLNTPKTEAAFQAFWEEIARLKAEGPTSEELQRAKLNIRSHAIFEKESVGRQAGKLAYFLATANDLEFEEKYNSQIQNIAAEAVASAAQNYLNPTNLTAACLIPQQDFTKQKKKKMAAVLSGPILPKPGVVPKKKPPPVKKILLPSGVRLILKEDHSLPIVAITACVKGGLLAENPHNNGIGNLMAHCLTKGTKHRSSLEVAELVEKTAGHLEGFSGKNSFGLRSEFLAEYTDQALGLFFEVLFTPAWDKKEFVKEKTLNLEAIKNLEDNLSALAFLNFQKKLFGPHPYALRELGSPQSLNNLTAQHMKAWHQKLLGAKNMVLSVVGDIGEKSLAGLLNKHLQGIPKKAFPFAPLHPPSKPKQMEKVVTHKKKEQAHLVLGFLGPAFTNPDYYPMTVLNDLLAGMGGRLFIELRDKLSLAYSVTSVFSPGLDPGYFAVYLGCEPTKIARALKAIEKELARITTTPVEPKEFEKTKQHLVGTYELELQRNLGLSQLFGFDELYGQGFQEVLRYPEKILRVRCEDVLNVAKKYIDLKNYVLSIVQPT